MWDMKRITQDAWLFHSYMHKLCFKTQSAAYSDNILRHHRLENWTKRQAATLCFLLKANSHCADRHPLTATGTLSGFIGSVFYLLVLVCACFRQLNRSWNVYKCLLSFWLAIFFDHAYIDSSLGLRTQLYFCRSAEQLISISAWMGVFSC